MRPPSATVAIATLAVAFLPASGSTPARAQQVPVPAMSFFVTSASPGKGGDLGGLAGADRFCQGLAQAVGAGGKTWHAYLSTQPEPGKPAVNARDRIGKGPWVNARGVRIAASVAQLHGEANGIDKQTALDEHGNIINGRGDSPNQHDILTGSRHDGTAFPAGEDKTCHNWTSGDAGSAIVGHTDLTGNTRGPNWWNYSHATPGCGVAALARVGGAGKLYCFAVR